MLPSLTCVIRLVQHCNHVLISPFKLCTTASSKSNNKSDKKVHKKEDRGDEDEEEEEEFNEADYSNQERITKQSLRAAKRRILTEKKSSKNRRKRDIDSESDTEQEEDSDDEVPSITEKSTGRLRKGTTSATATAAAAATTSASSPSSSSIKADKSDSDSDSNDLHISSDTESVNSSGNEKVENSKRRSKDVKSKSNRHERDNKLPSPAAKETRKATIKWTAEEDSILKEQFSLFRGSRSVFEVISMDTDLM